MQFIDKALNWAIKWESVDVTIPEMLDFIQTEILEKASDKELAELKKGMQKTFALLVGRGGSERYYPSYSASVRVCLRFHVLTHQLHEISLQDTENKKEYFIPSGKTYCTKLQGEVLRRMARYSYGVNGSEQKHRSGGRYSDKTPGRQNKIVCCRNCGHQELAENAFFCKKCGSQIQPPDAAESSIPYINEDAFADMEYSSPKSAYVPSRGHFQRSEQSRRSPILKSVVVVLGIAGLVLGGILIWLQVHANDSASIVQNGYLGEYTDYTVQELLDGYYGGMGYRKGEWASGESDNIAQLVDVRFVHDDELFDPVRIQFQVMDNKCFRIIAFVDPMQESEKNTDIYFNVNNIYYTYFVQKHREIVGDRLKEMELILRLQSIDSKSVMFGAPANYDGDRSELYIQFGEKPLGVSVALLFDSYHYLDLSYYYPDTEPTEFTEAEIPTDETKPPQTVPTSTAPTTPTEYDQVLDKPSSPIVGYVTESSGGLNIRNGPGRDYAQIGRLAPNEAVTIYETVPVGMTSWGRIGIDQWACMDYIVTQTSSSVSMLAEVMRAVIKGEQDFTYLGTAEKADVNEWMNLYNVDFLGADYLLDYPLTPRRFGVIDLDGNGYDEVLVEMDGGGGWYILLHSFMGDVYGSAYGGRWMRMFKSGIACESSSASDSSFYRLEFDGQYLRKITLPADTQVEWDPIEMYDITAANIERYIVR